MKELSYNRGHYSFDKSTDVSQVQRLNKYVYHKLKSYTFGRLI